MKFIIFFFSSLIFFQAEATILKCSIIKMNNGAFDLSSHLKLNDSFQLDTDSPTISDAIQFKSGVFMPLLQPMVRQNYRSMPLNVVIYDGFASTIDETHTGAGSQYMTTIRINLFSKELILGELTQLYRQHFEPWSMALANLSCEDLSRSN